MKPSPDKLRERFVEFLRIRDIRLSDAELDSRITDFLAMANVLGLRDNDEVFGFLIANEAYRLVNLDAVLKFRQAMETDAAKLAKSLRADIASSAETAAKKSTSRWMIAAVLIMAIAFGGAAWLVNRNYQAALAKFENVISLDAKARQTAVFMESDLGKKVLALKENGELEQLLDFAGSKVGKFAIRAHAHDELAGLLKFALSPAGTMAREMGQN